MIPDAVARYRGLCQYFYFRDPGACAPGFMLSPASRAFNSDVVVQTIAPDYATYAEKLATGADSILALPCPAQQLLDAFIN